MKITVKSYHAVAVWRWNTNDEQCSICYQPFDMCCETCTIPGESCPPAWGECTHQYHMHCINRWLTADNKNCPMCRRPFKLREDIHGVASIREEPIVGLTDSEGEEEAWPEIIMEGVDN